MEVKVAAGGRDVLEVVRLLDGHGLTPDSLDVREPTLDDVFLTLTGHKAEEPQVGDGAESASDRQLADRGAA